MRHGTKCQEINWYRRTHGTMSTIPLPTTLLPHLLCSLYLVLSTPIKYKKINHNSVGTCSKCALCVCSKGKKRKTFASRDFGVCVGKVGEPRGSIISQEPLQTIGDTSQCPGSVLLCSCPTARTHLSPVPDLSVSWAGCVTPAWMPE